MFSSVLISLFFIVKLNDGNTLHLQENQSRYYSIIERNKNVPSSNSSNLLKSSANSNKIHCLVDCNKLLICNIAIYISDGLCALYKKEVLYELIDSDDGQETTVFQCQR